MKITTKLEHTGEKGTTTFLRATFDVEKEFGGRRVPVRGTINGVPYRSTLVNMGGMFCIPVCKELRDQIGAEAGDTVTWVVERDTAERTMEPTPELAAALKKNKAARETWEKLSFTHKKEYVRWLTEAKKEETRTRRLAQAVEMLTAGTKTPDGA